MSMKLAAALGMTLAGATLSSPAPVSTPAVHRNSSKPSWGNPNGLPAYTRSMDAVRRKSELDHKTGRANLASLPKKTQRKLKKRK